MGLRWIVTIGALGLAGAAMYVLFFAEGGVGDRLPVIPPASEGPALDEIDAKSRAAMRDLLREAGDEE